MPLFKRPDDQDDAAAAAPPPPEQAPVAAGYQAGSMEGIPESDWCYPRDIDPSKPLMLSPDYLSRIGYRPRKETFWNQRRRGKGK